MGTAVFGKLLGSQDLDYGSSYNVIPTVFECPKLYEIKCAASEE
jgi:hypothetical protein